MDEQQQPSFAKEKKEKEFKQTEKSGIVISHQNVILKYSAWLRFVLRPGPVLREENIFLKIKASKNSLGIF